MVLCTHIIIGCTISVWILKDNTVTSEDLETRLKREAQNGEWSHQQESYNQRVQRYSSGQNWASRLSPSDLYNSRSSATSEHGPLWSSHSRRVKYSAEEPTWSSGDSSSFRFSDDSKKDSVFRSQGRSNSDEEPTRSVLGGHFRFSEDEKKDFTRSEYESQGRSNSNKEPNRSFSGGNFKFSDEDNKEEIQSSLENQGKYNSAELSNNNREHSFRFSDEDKDTVKDVFGSQGRSNSDDSSKYGPTFSARSVETPNWSSNDFSDVVPRSRHSGRQSKVSAIFDSDKPTSFENSGEKMPTFYSSGDVTGDVSSPVIESGRHISPDTLATISETLGAINTVGRYLVNYTRGGMMISNVGDRYDAPPLPPKSNEDLPSAILTISKNVLGRNVTDSLAPLVRVLPIGKVTQESSINGIRSCTTPNGKIGYCEDLSNCPQLLLNLSNLRQSICFKSLFVPGVCCPRRNDPTFDPEPPPTTTRRPLILTTQVPLQLVTQSTAVFTTSTFNSIEYANEDCGVPEAAKFRVVGGEEALPGRWPWMAAIFLHGPRRTEFWCGGSLIGSKYILTAAHCTKDTRQRPFSAHQFTVRLGDIDLRREDEPSSPQTYRVVKVRAHPRFSRVGFYNDIAILVLERPIRRSRYVIPVCLPPPRLRNNNFIGENPTVIGWGTTYYGGKESTVQRQVALPVWKNEECDRTYFQPITENFICAGLKEGGKDACQGDSGGPLILKKEGRWMQIGIVSFGNKCGEPGYPGVYTRVTEYLSWIQENST